MGSPAADRRRAGAPQQSSLSMAVRGRGRGSGARPRRVPVERSDAGVAVGEEESSDGGGVVAEDEVGGDGPVVEEEANDEGPVAEEDENIGGVAEQDQEASVGRCPPAPPLPAGFCLRRWRRGILRVRCMYCARCKRTYASLILRSVVGVSLSMGSPTTDL